MMNLKNVNISEELQFAIWCEVEFDTKVLENGDIQVSWNNGRFVEIISLDSSEIEEVESVEEIQSIKAIDLVDQYNLTEKEVAVLDAMAYDQEEDGLPVYTPSIAKRAKLTQKQVVGVVSSLYNKGFIESYGDNEVMLGCRDMYHLTSEWFEKLSY